MAKEAGIFSLFNQLILCAWCIVGTQLFWVSLQSTMLVSQPLWSVDPEFKNIHLRNKGRVSSWMYSMYFIVIDWYFLYTVQSLWLLTLIFMALGCLQKTICLAIEKYFLLLESLTLEVFSNKYYFKEKITKFLLAKHSQVPTGHILNNWWNKTGIQDWGLSHQWPPCSSWILGPEPWPQSLPVEILEETSGLK